MNRPTAFLTTMLLAALTGCGGSNEPATYTIGGTATGIAGTGLMLKLNGGSDLALASNGAFVFPTAVASGTDYVVTISVQPVNPTQTCTLSKAAGKVASANVADVGLTCTTNVYAIGGNVSGLAGSGLVLQDNGGDDLPVTADGAFTFPTQLQAGAAYAVSVKTQPSAPKQDCVVSNGSGTLPAAAVSTVTVTCTTVAFAVGGSVNGLTGNGLVLSLNGSQSLAVGANGAFAFPTDVDTGAAYSVTVTAQPGVRREFCAVTRGSGVMASAAVKDVSIDCSVLAGFAYTAHAFPDELVAYGILAGGGLVPLPPVTLDPGSAIRQITASPDGRFLYVIDGLNAVIRVFSIDSNTGALAIAGAPVPMTGIAAIPLSFIFSTSGHFMYVDVSGAGLQTFAVNATTGALTPVGSVIPAGSRNFYRLVLTPDGKFLYALRNLLSGPPTPVVTIYSIDPNTGALTAGATSNLTNDMDTIAVHPSGRFFYTSVAHEVTLDHPVSDIQAYTLNPADGSLAPTGPLTTVDGSDHQLVFEPSGRFGYLVDTYNFAPTDNRLTALAVDLNTGLLTAVLPQTITPGVPLSTQFDVSGQHLFVGAANDARGTNSDIVVYSLGVNGALTQVGIASPASGTSTGFVGVVP